MIGDLHKGHLRLPDVISIFFSNSSRSKTARDVDVVSLSLSIATQSTLIIPAPKTTGMRSSRHLLSPLPERGSRSTSRPVYDVHQARIAYTAGGWGITLGEDKKRTAVLSSMMVDFPCGIFAGLPRRFLKQLLASTFSNFFRLSIGHQCIICRKKCEDVLGSNYWRL